jgi:pilus assembly protein CpaB
MKWAVTVLILLGVVAAISTAILVATLRGGPAEASVPSDAVVLAAKSLPAMTVITSSYVTEGTAEKGELPEGYLSSPVQAIGGVLGVPVVEGQVLTESCFVSKGAGAQLAAALPHGTRAVSITLSSRDISGGLLYPGCVVDVLASFRLQRTEQKAGRAISTTLLHGIQVLAVQGVSVVSNKAEPEEEGGRLRRGSSAQRVTVTLMVDPKQAEALQLAKTYGIISLAMRNPLDKYAVDTDATVLSEGRLARLGSVLSPTVVAAKRRLLGQIMPEDPNDPNFTAMAEAERAFQEMFGVEEGIVERSPSHWGVTVIRGADVKEQELDISKSEDVADDVDTEY